MQDNHEWQGRKENGQFSNGRKNIYYSHKNVIDLTQEESKELKDALLSENYINIDGVYVAEKKIGRPNKDVYKKELLLCKTLVSQGHKVFLLRENYTTGKSADTLTDNEFLELKEVTSLKKIGTNWGEAKRQSCNVFLYIVVDTSLEIINRQLNGRIKHSYLKNNHIKGKIYVFIAKRKIFKEFKISRAGILEEI